MATNTQIPAADQRVPVIAPGHTYSTITEKISNIVLTRPISLGWILGFLVVFSMMNMLMLALGYLFIKGTGIWGINIPIGWGFAIVNFVWWIGIGHAGTLISAILALLRQTWRNSINRFAEAMTLFAVACAGIFPLAHTGRPWLAYWLFPYPNTMNYWPNFRSPLVWDVFAVSTYGTISLVFWFVGLIPDLATLRDRATNKPAQIIYDSILTPQKASKKDDIIKLDSATVIWTAMQNNKVEAMLTAHRHEFLVTQPTPGQTTQIIAGNGGSLYESALPINNQFFGYTKVYVMKNGHVHARSFGRLTPGSKTTNTYVDPLPCDTLTRLQYKANITWGKTVPQFNPLNAVQTSGK